MVNLLILSLLAAFFAPLQGANSVFCAAAEYQQTPQNQLANQMSDEDDEDYEDEDDDDEDDDVIIMEEEVSEEKNF